MTGYEDIGSKIGYQVLPHDSELIPSRVETYHVFIKTILLLPGSARCVDSHAYCICYVNVMSLLLYHINCERSKCIFGRVVVSHVCRYIWKVLVKSCWLQMQKKTCQNTCYSLTPPMYCLTPGI